MNLDPTPALPWVRLRPTPKLVEACLQTVLYHRLPAAHRSLCDKRILEFLERVEIRGVLNHTVTNLEAIRLAFSCALLYAGRPEWDFPPPIRVCVSPKKFDKEYRPSDDGCWAGYVSAATAEVWIWSHVIYSSFYRKDGYHAPIHEFAHVMDFGVMEPRRQADGIPRELGLHRRDAWLKALARAQKRVVEPTGTFVLSTYAATNPVEAFACAVESFFEQPSDLRGWDAEIYGMLSEFLKQDPAGAAAPTSPSSPRAASS